MSALLAAGLEEGIAMEASRGVLDKDSIAHSAPRLAKVPHACLATHAPPGN